ncbi:MAG: hypothetical protein MJZ22_03115 [Candidatus Saccharibacteria bacterium]|nr:hypothetical protein [Candidatus Saccharibacteria bacterium]
MSLEFHKKKMVDLRAKLQKEKDAKKHDNEHYADNIKSASTTEKKAYWRKVKIEHAASHDRAIESIKRQIESCKESIDRERKRK